MIDWNATPHEQRMVDAIVRRYRKVLAANAALVGREHGRPLDLIDDQTAEARGMDIIACHRNGRPLDLRRFAAAERAGDLIHDVEGIARNLDRTTGRLINRFVPRFSLPWIPVPRPPSTVCRAGGAGSAECFVCKEPLTETADTWWVHLTTIGHLLPAGLRDVDPQVDQGWFPVGPSCKGRIPVAYRARWSDAAAARKGA